MLNSIIRFSLNNRLVVIIVSVALLVYGGWITSNLPVDVFPDLNRPIVTVITESHGLAPEEVETLVTLPIETTLNGMPGVTRIRSSSGIGISIIYVEFDWGTDVFRNRQLVAERLQLAKERLPEKISPIMGPISSVMGEIQFVGLVSKGDEVNPLELRTLADWLVRPRLMTIPGISQVVVMGGEVKQFQILVSSDKLQKKMIPLQDLERALSEISQNTTGGFLDIGDKEYLIRPVGRVESLEEIENTAIGIHLGFPVRVKDVATVKIGPKLKRGEGSVDGKHSVVMTIQKQPGASTIELTQQIDDMLEGLKKTLPKGVEIRSDLFKQSRFIEASVNNVIEALRDGAIMVAIILFLFLLNIRTTAITLISIPLSLVITFIIFKIVGMSINTMTLGGLAIAIGELVDDAIVDVENVFRRLKENRHLETPRHPLYVIYKASSEIRNSIVFSTIIVILVFIPLFALSGIEGKLFAPLGISYIISLTASLFVSLTLTPVLCYYLISKSKIIEHKDDGFLVRRLKKWDEMLLKKAIRHPTLVMAFCGLLLLGSIALIPFMGTNFLPSFNEGTATIGIASLPGISLKASDELGTKIEKAILSVPEAKSTIRRTGRAEMDEHAEGVHWSEIDVDFKEGGRAREVVLQEIRKKIEEVGDVYVNIGQPISHRLDHLLSGVRAQIAIKIFGTDLSELRRLGGQVEEALKDVDGIVDLQLEPLVLIPQLKIMIDREDAGVYGISPGGLTKDLEVALNGVAVAQVIEGQKLFDVFMRLDDESRSSPVHISETIIKTMPNGKRIKVSDVAEVYQGTGPNMVNRENLQRRIVISANSHDRDLGSLIKEIQKKVNQKLKLPEGYFIEYGGQFESQQQATRMIFFLGILSLLGVFFVLYVHFKSVMLTLQVMVNIPLALIGSVLAIYLTERELSLATMIAFITLCGIASRNGIMMISHYIHLVKEEGEHFTEEMVIRGSLERLVPVLMTALTAILALSPLLFAKGEPGKEILYPVAVVIIGGLLSSTLLDIFVTPAIFYKYGKRSVDKLTNPHNDQNYKLTGENE
jgi:CzcA family heavy metal efflux pump